MKIIFIHVILNLGSRNAKVVDAGHETNSMFGQQTKFEMSRTDAERLFRQLVVDGILDEDLIITAQDHAVCYVKLGKRAEPLLQNKLMVIMKSPTFVIVIGE